MFPLPLLAGPWARRISFTSHIQTFLPVWFALTATTTRVMIYPRTTKVPDQYDRRDRAFCGAYGVSR